MEDSLEDCAPIICPYCGKDVFEFGNNNYCYDHGFAKTLGKTGIYTVHQDCYRKAKRVKMKPSERLKEIEHDAPLGLHYVKLNNEDTLWLIARVKRLTEALETIRDYDDYSNGQHALAHRALEGSDE